MIIGSIVIIALLSVVGAVVYSSFSNKKVNLDSQDNRSTRQNYEEEMRLISQAPSSPLSTDAQDALIEALNDEYKAQETYVKIMEKFGEVNPFANIVKAEESHIKSLIAIFEKYDLEVPENTWIDKVTAPATLTLACQAGYEAEVANAALYIDKLLPMVNGYADIEIVFTKLMEASQNNHLKAFEKCK